MLTELVLPHMLCIVAAPQGKFYEELGKRVTVARETKDLSQQKLAELLGLSRTSVTNIEKGRQPVDVHVLVEIANILKIDLLSLIPEQSMLNVPEKIAGIEKYSAEERRFVDSILGTSTLSKKERK